jgi:hypothetical protein
MSLIGDVIVPGAPGRFNLQTELEQKQGSSPFVMGKKSRSMTNDECQMTKESPMTNNET